MSADKGEGADQGHDRIEPRSVAAATPVGIASKQAVHRHQEREAASRAAGGQGFIGKPKPPAARAGSPVVTFIIVAAVLVGTVVAMVAMSK